MSETIEKKWSQIVHFTDKQIEATRTADSKRYTLYGGAAGGGKSYWLRWYSIMTLIKWFKKYNLKNVRAGLFSEDYPSLKDRHIGKLEAELVENPWLGKLHDSAIDGLSLKLSDKLGGGVLAMRNLDDPSKYLSSEFALIGVDELTRNSEEVFSRLRSRLRWPGINDTRFIAATNPGEVGHAWVKKRWIDKDFPEEEAEMDEFAYIKALPTDNPHLESTYITALKSLPEQLRKAYLDGNWDVFAGQYFSEWNQERHVCEPYELPETFRRIRCIDHGRTAPTACYWGAVDYDGRIIWYREYYAAGLDADVNAREIAKLSAGERYWFSVGDASIFSKTGAGETIGDIYARNGVTLEPAPKNRLAGWALFHEYLRGDVMAAKMVFFKTCPNAIRTIPTLVFDKHHVEDLDSSGEDHPADAISYGLQYLNEQKSPKPRTGIEEKLWELQQKSRLSPKTLNVFYGRGR